MANLPMKQEYSFIDKIKQFFRKIFNKEDKVTIVQEELDIEENIQSKNSFKEHLETKVENDYLEDIKRNDFIKQVEKNPNILYGLSLDRLKKLEAYYDKLLEEDRLELNKLKKSEM